MNIYIIIGLYNMAFIWKLLWVIFAPPTLFKVKCVDGESHGSHVFVLIALPAWEPRDSIKHWWREAVKSPALLQCRDVLLDAHGWIPVEDHSGDLQERKNQSPYALLSSWSHTTSSYLQRHLKSALFSKALSQSASNLDHCWRFL